LKHCLETYEVTLYAYALMPNLGSSYPGYVDERRAEEFVNADVLRLFGEGMKAARRRYRAYVLACLEQDDEELKRCLGQSRYGVGDEEYVKGLERELRGRRSGDERDRDVAYPRERIDVERIEGIVAREYGVAAERLQAGGRWKGGAKAKVAVMELACRLSGLTQRDIGHRYGGVTSQAVTMARKRVKDVLGAGEVERLVQLVRDAQ